MRIESTGVQPPTPQTPATRPTALVTDQAATPAAEPGTASEFVVTGRLAALLAGVRQSPDVRPSVVALAASLLASGDFNTAESAAAAAAAVVARQPSDAPLS